MTELGQWKEKINVDDLIMYAFGFDIDNAEQNEDRIFNRIYWVLDKAGVPDEHEDLQEIWDFVNEQANSYINNEVN